MKNLKSIHGKLLALLFLVISIAFVQSCKDDEEDPADKTALSTKISDANTLIASTEEGTANGQYAAGSQASLQTVIDAAQTVYDNADATQTEVDNSVTNLTAAITAYEAELNTPIAPESLIGHWGFDEGSGTSAADFSDNGFNGTFNTGNTGFGGGDPTWAADRHGNAGKAVQFDQGAFIEVPYNTALNPAQMTIALWVYADEIRESNRFLGLHSWNGYKFQLQSANKAFFTASAADGIYDKDTEPSLDILKWYHVAVTFGGGEMAFYVNGVNTITHTELTGDLVTVTGHNLAFGTSTNKFADTGDNYDDATHADYHVIPVAWGGYFHGRLDEIRMYSAVLTSSQISSIYNLEKPE